MNDAAIAICVLILVVCVAAPSFLLGYDVQRSRQRTLAPKDVEKYIARQFPDKWTAYKKGVHEGYAQGLRDSREDG